MFTRFFPDLIVDSINDISKDTLTKLGVKGLILDIDNTLVASHTKEADEKLLTWIKEKKLQGISLCIVSNASLNRVTLFNKKISIHAVHRANKPSKKGFLNGAKAMNLKPSEVAMVGDQIFTDIWGGKRAGMKTILVTPIDPKEFFLVQLKRFPEKLILKRYYKRLGKGHA